MRRFQCIKTMGDAFTAGRSYWVHEPSDGYERAVPGGTCFIDNQGDIDEVTPEGMITYFQELPEEDIPDEVYENPMEADGFSNGFPKGCAIACATLLTAMVIIYLIVKWNS